MFDDDNELLYLIKENNNEARDILYSKYKNIIVSKANKVFPYVINKGIELSDLIQEGMLGLEEAIKNYKESENTMFYTFALLCIDRKIKTCARLINQDKNKILNESISFDGSENGDILNFVVNENSNPEYDVLSSENLEELHLKISDKLTILESKIYELKANGATNDEICKVLEIDKKTIYNALHRIKDKIKNIEH